MYYILFIIKRRLFLAKAKMNEAKEESFFENIDFFQAYYNTSSSSSS